MITAVASGTTSRLTGGKFANGAVTRAFVHMFNASLAEATKKMQEGREKGFTLTVVKTGSGENDYFAVDEAYATKLTIPAYQPSYGSGFECASNFVCSIIKGAYGGYSDGSDYGNYADMGLGTKYNMFQKSFGIIGVGFGIIQGAKKYFDYQKKYGLD